jgi:hypothetical protein
MNPKFYYHTPTKPISTRASCPVCHQTVYSRAGIHPQCAVIQSDPPRMRAKKQQAGALLDPSIDATDPTGPDVVVEPPIVVQAATIDRPIVPMAVVSVLSAWTRARRPASGASDKR